MIHRYLVQWIGEATPKEIPDMVTDRFRMSDVARIERPFPMTEFKDIDDTAMVIARDIMQKHNAVGSKEMPLKEVSIKVIAFSKLDETVIDLTSRVNHRS